MSTIDEGFALARACYQRAYAPYSNFNVGAAIKAQGVEELYGGCNVENASLGGTICAERSALCALISAKGRCQIEWVVVVSNMENPVSPCGICRQVLSEFCPDDALVYLANLNAIVHTYTFAQLLPHCFRSFF